MEEAAASLGRRRPHGLPARSCCPTSLPAISAGAGLALRPRHRRVRLGRPHLAATSRSRPGRLGLHLRPGRERRPAGAAAVSVVLLADLARRAARCSAARRSAGDGAPMSSLTARRCRARIARCALRCAPRATYLRSAGRCRSAWSSTAPSSTAWSRSWTALSDPPALHAFWLTLADHRHRRARSTRSSASSARSLLVRRTFPGKALLNALIDLPFAVSPVVVGLVAGPASTGANGWFGGALADSGIQVIFACPAWCWRRSSSRCRSWCARSCPVLREIGDEQEQAAATLGASPLADLLARHPAGDPLGRRLRRRPDDGPRARRVRRGQRRLAARSPGRRDADHARRGALPAVRPGGRLHRHRSCSPCIALAIAARR